MKAVAIFAVLSCITALGKANAITEKTRALRDVEGDPDLEAYLREAIENFREQMKTGIDAIKMPILDPLVLRHLDITVREDAATLDLKIHEIIVRDLSKFKLDRLRPDLEKFFIKLDLTIPVVYSNGKYKVDGKLLRIFPLYGEGNFDINITRATVSGDGKLDFDSDTLQMTTLIMDLSWEDLAINLENFLGGGRFSKVLQKIIPSVGKEIFQSFKPMLMNEMSKALKNELNKELRKPKVKNIIKAILPDR